jgi:hypothetical protein
MALTPRGIQKPDASTPISMLNIAGALADTTDAALTALETALQNSMASRVQSVRIVVPTVAGTTVTRTATFPANFSSLPHITATPNATNPQYVNVSRSSAPTLNSVQISVHRQSGTGSGDVAVDVIGVAS